MVVGGDEHTASRSLTEAKRNGVPIDGIGIQAHELRTLRFPLGRVQGPLDPGKTEVQRSELSQPLEVLQTGVGDLGAAEAQFLELPQPLEMLQTGVGDAGVVKV